MKVFKFLLVVTLLFQGSTYSQTINFESYDRVTDINFKRFLNLFGRKDLPVSTTSIIAGVNIPDLKGPALPQASIDKYLKKNGELITGALYDYKPDDDTPEVPIVGVFYPLFKLPTSGNYVLLVFAQVDSNFDGNDKVFALVYDLSGNYLSFANELYSANSEYIDNYIDTNLQSHYTYVLYYENNEVVFPPRDAAFTAEEAHSILQINNQGVVNEVSFTKTPGQFEFSKQEYRFKKVN